MLKGNTVILILLNANLKLCTSSSSCILIHEVVAVLAEEIKTALAEEIKTALVLLNFDLLLTLGTSFALNSKPYYMSTPSHMTYSKAQPSVRFCRFPR